MKTKISAGLLRCFTAVSFLFLFAGGCADDREDSFEKSNKVSLVVALGRPVMKGKFRVFQIVEIWRDESRGEFSRKVGDILEDSLVYADDVQEGVLFWAINQGRLCYCGAICVYDGVVYSERRLSVEEAKQIVQNTKPTPVDLNIPVRPWPGEGTNDFVVPAAKEGVCR